MDPPKCPVCDEALTERVSCPRCTADVCCECVKSFLTSDAVQDEPRCMMPGCGAVWPPEMLDVLEARFRRGPLKDMRKNQLLRNELALLPLSQPSVGRRARMKALEAGEGTADARRELKLLRRQETAAAAGRAPGDEGEAAGPAAGPAEPPVKCIAPDCRGFMAAEGSCGVCAAEMCTTCHALKKPEQAHACNPDDVASVTAVAADSVPCPKCRTPIHRESGCNQMWCTVPGCKTAFDYRTGAVSTGPVHNPHYFEALRAAGMPLEPPLAPNAPCRVSIERIMRMLADLPAEERRLSEAYRFSLHLENEEVPRFAPPARAPQWRNHDLRVMYLEKEIDEDELKRRLHERDRRASYRAGVRDMAATTATVLRDTLSRLQAQLQENEFESAAARADYDARLAAATLARTRAKVAARDLAARDLLRSPTPSLQSILTASMSSYVDGLNERVEAIRHRNEEVDAEIPLPPPPTLDDAQRERRAALVAAALADVEALRELANAELRRIKARFDKRVAMAIVVEHATWKLVAPSE